MQNKAPVNLRHVNLDPKSQKPSVAFVLANSTTPLHAVLVYGRTKSVREINTKSAHEGSSADIRRLSIDVEVGLDDEDSDSYLTVSKLFTSPRSRPNELKGHMWAFYSSSHTPFVRPLALPPLYKDFEAIVLPVSGIDKPLEDNPGTTHFEDSFYRWQSICASSFIRNATLVIIFNDCKRLRQKITSGLLAKDFLPGYSKESNDVGDIIKYMKKVFLDEYMRLVAHRSNLCYMFEIEGKDLDYTQTGQVLNCIAAASDQRIVLSVGQLYEELSIPNPFDEVVYEEPVPFNPHSFAGVLTETANIPDDASVIYPASEYSKASSRTETTNYGHYCRRMALSQSTFEIEYLESLSEAH
ncbi:hypothetical protein CVT26_005651 [Gymnopilus dilepis]|uniref:Uncharacterized protein n=1 Tax=Gymnopilus dilepis TaxID=231916 RepID=A0A409XZZ9_9AGAR|nr:hypothetical protein CVT26_005651 [Gymnopilus dilepis]